MNQEDAVRTNHPIYIILDVSESMWPAWSTGRRRAARGPTAEAFMSLIPNTLMALSESPTMSNAASVSVLAFSDKPQVLQPMRSLAEPPIIANPSEGVQTNYQAILEFLVLRFHHDARAITEDQRRRGFTVTIAHPLVLFIPDGAPFVGATYQQPQQWMPARNRLVTAPRNAQIATIGLPGACEPVLWRLATGGNDGDRNAFIA